MSEYQIMWDSASSGLLYSYLATTELTDSLVYTYSEGIVKGYTYSFKVKASNAIGDSLPSQEVSVIAADYPD